MRFKFADPKVAMEIGYEKVNGKQYGELEYDLIGQTGVKLSGNEYTLDIPNQRVPLEPLTDLSYVSSGAPVVFFPLVYSQFSDLKGAEQQTKPMFTYIAKNFASNPLSYDTGGNITRVTEYITPSNVFTDDFEPSDTPSTGLLGLYFGEELNEYNAIDSTVGFGLFNNFYKGLTAMMFDEDKRSVVFNSQIPTSIIGKMSLSDTLIINNSFYNINSIDTNYLSGESKLDLTLVGKSQLSYFVDGTKVIANTSATDALGITYLNTSGFVDSSTISTSSTLNLSLIGDVISFSHSDYTVTNI
jgi:hypothetical protein